MSKTRNVWDQIEHQGGEDASPGGTETQTRRTFRFAWLEHGLVPALLILTLNQANALRLAAIREQNLEARIRTLVRETEGLQDKLIVLEAVQGGNPPSDIPAVVRETAEGIHRVLRPLLEYFLASGTDRPRLQAEENPRSAKGILPPETPPADEKTRGPISGVVCELEHPERYKIVIYAWLERHWCLQTHDDDYLNDIGEDGGWATTVVFAEWYAILVVEGSYSARAVLDRLPAEGGPILSKCRARAQVL